MLIAYIRVRIVALAIAIGGSGGVQGDGNGMCMGCGMWARVGINACVSGV